MNLKVNLYIQIGFYFGSDLSQSAVGYYSHVQPELHGGTILKTYFNDTDTECGFEIYDHGTTFYI